MTEEFVIFLSREYLLTFLLLLFSRGVDFLSTRVATPHLVLEGNPIARRLGWRWGSMVNLLLCVGFAFWPLPAVVICTTSVMVAARNFQSAWLMRSMGEQSYREWYVEKVRQTSVPLYLFCLAAQTFLLIAVGGVLMWYSGLLLVPWAIGLGIIGYAVAVAFYTLLSFWRLRRALRYRYVAIAPDHAFTNARRIPEAGGTGQPDSRHLPHSG